MNLVVNNILYTNKITPSSSGTAQGVDNIGPRLGCHLTFLNYRSFLKK
jgi:hypothetical protein